MAAEVDASRTWFDGRTYNISYPFVIEVRDGLVCAITEYMDMLAVFLIENPEEP